MYFKSTKNLFLLFFILLIGVSNLKSQCKDFSVNSCKPSLYPYIHDGIYNAHVLTSGESAELFKTFFARQNYRMIVCKPDNLPNIEMVVMDTKRNILYSNKLNNDVNTWDFNLESSQQLIVSLNILNVDAPENGCVCVLIGLEDIP